MKAIDLESIPLGYDFDEDGVYKPRTARWLEKNHPELARWTRAYLSKAKIKQFDYSGGYLIIHLFEDVKLKALPPGLSTDGHNENYLSLLHGLESRVYGKPLITVPYTEYDWRHIKAMLQEISNPEPVLI